MTQVGTLRLVSLMACAFVIFAASPGMPRNLGPDAVVRYVDDSGKTVVGHMVPPSPPPPGHVAAHVADAVPNPAQGTNALSNVPSFSWVYGCSATSAGMMMGYYDRTAYGGMYSGPANGGLCPLNNSTWSSQGPECPFVASHLGIDGRANRGYVDDYWVGDENVGNDPYIGHWAEHSPLDCTGDFMGTSQSKWHMKDGWTMFFFNEDGSPLVDNTTREPYYRDGCHGMKLFAQSRGYSVQTNYNQYIHDDSTGDPGFTFQQFVTEIDAGRPVLIQVSGHTMIGYGYNSTTRVINIHNTWDYGSDTMVWGGEYSGMEHYGVTVLRLSPIGVDIPAFTPDAGDYYAPVNVVVNCTTAGATIHYTTNGQTPTATDPTVPAGGTLFVDRTQTLKAKAFKEGLADSPVKTALYRLVVTAPTISPPGGTVTQGSTVTLSTVSPGADVHYTTNGNNPTTSDPIATAPITLTTSCTVKAIASKTNWATSAVTTAVFTVVDITPPQITDVQVTGIDRNTATITWTTDDPATSQVQYGTTPSYGQTTTENTALVTSHSVTLTGLAPGTIYHYKVKSTNGDALTSYSGDLSFMTRIAPLEIVVDDLQGTCTGTWTSLTTTGGWPIGSSQYVYAANKQSSTTGTFTWTPTVTIPGHYSVYCWYSSATDRTASARYTVAYSGAQMLVAVVNQTANGSQWYKIADARQFDAGASGYVQLTNKTGEADGTKKVVADAIKLEYAENDTTPPSAPTNLIATASASEIGLSWSPSTDDFVVVGYEVYRDGQAVGITASTSYSDAGLAANEGHTYAVSAYDARANESAQSTPLSKYTLARPVSASHVGCSRLPNTWYPTPGFTFTNDGFGAGKLAYYRFVWDNSPGHAWIDTEAQWTTASMVLNATSASPYWYLHLKGYNGDGVACGTLDYGPYCYGTSFARIADAMNNPDGVQVVIGAYKPITGVFGSFFYIEESDRTRGIRVDATTTRAVGDTVSVSGRLAGSDGERRLSDAAVLGWAPGAAPLPFMTRIAMLGGKAPDAYTLGIASANAPYNMGLLVRVVGAVVSHTTGSFVLDDGCGATVTVCSDAAVSDGSYVGVTGICAVESGARVMRTRTTADVRIYAAP